MNRQEHQPPSLLDACPRFERFRCDGGESEFIIATNQVDFAVPAKFGLTYRDKNNLNKTPLCIHRAPLGTHERFIGFLIEHYAGNFPFWLAPDQVRVITLNDDKALIDYAKPIRPDSERAHEACHQRQRGTDSKTDLRRCIGGCQGEKQAHDNRTSGLPKQPGGALHTSRRATPRARCGEEHVAVVGHIEEGETEAA